ncbi:MAG: GNAT family N-acetyltransferase [Chthonomonadales bacterium]
MPDMLVQLLKLPEVKPMIADLRTKGIVIRRALSYEAGIVREFIDNEFGQGWANEVAPAYCIQPTGIFIALKDGVVIGFAAIECVANGFFGPTGVLESERGQGIGAVLLLASLWALRERGYVYGIIGGAGPTEFYARTCGATVIPGSVPGIYADPIGKVLPVT